MTDPWRAAWTAALDELELELERAEALLRSEEPAAGEGAHVWQPPSLPPIPPDLVTRARAIHQRQLHVAASMTSRLGGLGKQAVVTQRMERPAVPSRPVLFDAAC